MLKEYFEGWWEEYSLQKLGNITGILKVTFKEIAYDAYVTGAYAKDDMAIPVVRRG